MPKDVNLDVLLIAVGHVLQALYHRVGGVESESDARLEMLQRDFCRESSAA